MQQIGVTEITVLFSGMNQSAVQASLCTYLFSEVFMSNLSNVKIVLFDQDTDLRSATRHMLRDIGLKDVCYTELPRVVIKELLENRVDLLICDLQQADEIMCKMVKKLRAQKLSKNPFPVTIGLTGNSDHEHLSKAVNSGFDSVLLKPIDLNTLKKRVLSFQRERKPFVVTANYVGPDRRGIKRMGESSAERIDVPNPVELIANGMTRRVMLAHVEEHRERLIEFKGKCDLDSIVWIAEQMNLNFGSSPEEDAFPLLAKQLKRDVKNVKTQYGNHHKPSVSDHCVELEQISMRIHEDPLNVDYIDIDQLLNISRSLKKAICDRPPAVEERPAPVKLAIVSA